jgi:NADH-quinone oxidoreductase subunit K
MLVHRRNVILLMVCIELMLLAVNMNFIAFNHQFSESAGEVFVFFILTVAAAEAAIGLAIAMLLYRNRGTINVADMNHLKG